MKTLGFATLLVAACTAQSDRRDTYVHYNANTSMVPFDDPAFATSEEPIAMHEVSFDRTLGVSVPQGNILWNWKLSISEVALPNTTDFTSQYNTQPDSRVAYTTFELSWPGQDGNVNQAVLAETRPPPYRNESCIYHLWATLPQNVSDAWNSSSSSCRSAIGAECESYIIGSMGDMRGCRVENRPSLSLRPACAGSFGAASGNLAIQSYSFGNVSGPIGDVGFQSGDRMAWAITDSYAPGNTTAFQMAKNRFYMMIITNSYGTQVICNRIGDGSDDQQSASTRHANPRTTLLAATVLLTTVLGSML